MSPSENAQQVVHRAWLTRTYKKGYCLKAVREWHGIPALYADARLAWEGTPKEHRHFSPPPLAAPIFFWTPAGHGHVAVAIGSGWCISTDQPSSGRVGVVTHREIVEEWGARYLGWTSMLNGRIIPWLT